MAVNASGPAVNGKRVAAFNAAMFDRYGRHCHLCGGYGADTADHIKPVSTHPELRWDLANVRPAHQACNSSRKDRALTLAWDAGW